MRVWIDENRRLAWLGLAAIGAALLLILAFMFRSAAQGELSEAKTEHANLTRLAEQFDSLVSQFPGSLVASTPLQPIDELVKRAAQDQQIATGAISRTVQPGTQADWQVETSDVQLRNVTMADAGKLLRVLRSVDQPVFCSAIELSSAAPDNVPGTGRWEIRLTLTRLVPSAKTPTVSR